MTITGAAIVIVAKSVFPGRFVVHAPVSDGMAVTFPVVVIYGISRVGIVAHVEQESELGPQTSSCHITF